MERRRSLALLYPRALFVDNLLNKLAGIDLYNAYGVNAATTQPVGLNRPRTVGLDCRWDF
jgi:hypothetical protein